MSFELEELCVVAPLDATKGEWYTKLVYDDISDMEINNIYNVTAMKEYYINPAVNGEIK